jgi:hypothetical protein
MLGRHGYTGVAERSVDQQQCSGLADGDGLMVLGGGNYFVVADCLKGKFFSAGSK